MQKWWFSDRVSHAGIWLLYFLLSWSYYAAWLPLEGIHVPPLRLFIFSVNTVTLTLMFPYFLYWFRKKYSSHWPYWQRISVHGIFLVVASALLALLDVAYLTGITDTSVFLDTWHLTSRTPTLFILSLIINWMRIRRDFEEHKKQQEQLENARQEAELRMLKAQISPHFLFNALNNLNSLIHLDPARASDTVVKLSDLLRHVIYDGHKTLIPLDDEVDYLRNYIALATMKERMQQHVKFETEVAPGHFIEPLILVNFIENAFKHGSIEKPEDRIEISLRAANGKIVFSCCNPYKEQMQKDATHGIGLSNVKQRLGITYPEKHSLTITQQGGMFNVLLEINQL
ncbi:MAG: histidine kinase [Bacteroidia bacterium]|jgi:signal transduction histidine kinase|nr:histidine kinase [Bacteroidia bacterium]